MTIILFFIKLLLRILTYITALVAIVFYGNVYTFVTDGINEANMYSLQDTLSSIFKIYIPLWKTKILILLSWFLPASFFAVTSLGFLYLRNKINQWQLDIQASRLLQRVKESKEEKYVLYLRPFITTKRIMDTSQFKAPLPLTIGQVLQPRTLEIETILSKASKPIGKLVTFGHPGEHIGAARIKTSEKEWKKNVIQLVQKAHSIICLPLAYKGTKWEIEFLKNNGLLEKTLFIKPSTDHYPDIEKEWLKAVQEFNAINIYLPEFPKPGLLFQLDNNGKANNITVLKSMQPKEIKEKLKEISHHVN